jgi:hypothetical protein
MKSSPTRECARIQRIIRWSSINPGPDSSALWHVAISVEDWTHNIVLRRHPIPIMSISVVRPRRRAPYRDEVTSHLSIYSYGAFCHNLRYPKRIHVGASRNLHRSSSIRSAASLHSHTWDLTWPVP